MSLITLENICIAFGHVALLDKVNLRLEKGEKLCLIGRNGEGKSTLLRLIAAQIQADSGQIYRQPQLRISYLAQEPSFNPNETVFNAVASALGDIGALVKEYHQLVQQVSQNSQDNILKQLAAVQQQLEAKNGWLLEQQVEHTLSRLGLEADLLVEQLSGGWRRRVAIAQALVTQPQVLLLDEPTNHLDIEAIAWLENVLLEYNGCLLFVSHDREFMQKVATSILELDRGILTIYPNDYHTYLRTKQANLAAEANKNAKFDKVLSQEESWIRQGIKARRTRNEGRVRALKQLRLERSQRRNVQGKINLQLDSGVLSGKSVIEAENISKNYSFLVETHGSVSQHDKSIIKSFSCTIMRGDKIGIIGPNGVGKSTLLKLLLAELQPDTGTIKHGTQLQVAYFDQLRAQLDPEQTLFDAVGQGSDNIVINGNNKHVIAYLSDFLFPPARAYSPIKALSGGECNRLLLAKLFTKTANVLVMDEPTNDLDVESLELLEELLSNYNGTLLLVTHDRQFLDNVVTSIFAFEGAGIVKEYVGGYNDWLRQRPPPAILTNNAPVKKIVVKNNNPSNKLTYKQQRELESLPAQIEKIETELADLQNMVANNQFYKQSQPVVATTLAKIKQLEIDLADCYQRWEQLET